MTYTFQYNFPSSREIVENVAKASATSVAVHFIEYELPISEKLRVAARNCEPRRRDVLCRSKPCFNHRKRNPRKHEDTVASYSWVATKNNLKHPRSLDRLFPFLLIRNGIERFTFKDSSLCSLDSIFDTQWYSHVCSNLTGMIYRYFPSFWDLPWFLIIIKLHFKRALDLDLIINKE